MKVHIKYAKIIHTERKKYNFYCSDKNRKQYFFNVCKSISNFENILHDYFDIIEICQSPYSNTVYLDVVNPNIKKHINVRISDHDIYNDRSDYQIETNDGNFFLNCIDLHILTKKL